MEYRARHQNSKIIKFILFFTVYILGLPTSAHEIRLARDVLQEQVNTRLPITQDHNVISLTLSNPHLELLEDEQRLSIRTDVEVVTVFGSTSQGWISIDGKLRYQRSDHSFYVDDARITGLQIDGLNPNLHPHIRSIAQDTLAPILTKKPIYTLSDNNIQEAIAKNLLQSITIEEDAIVASVSIY